MKQMFCKLFSMDSSIFIALYVLVQITTRFSQHHTTI